MPIAYTQDNKEYVANLAPGVTPEQAAKAMKLAPGTWRVITQEEATALQKPTPEEELAAMAATARAEAIAILDDRMRRRMAQTEAFTDAEFAIFARAGLFASWAPGMDYAPGARFIHEGVVYETQQPVTAREQQPPCARDMPAVYRPLGRDSEPGSPPSRG